VLEVALPTRERVDTIVRTTGRISFDDRRVAHVFSAATGRVIKIYVDLGSRVKRGDPLALVRSVDVGAATADLAKADADVIASTRDLARKQYMLDQHAASQADLEAAQDSARKARAEQDRARLRSELLRAGEHGPRVTSDFVVRSPIAGEVIARAATPGVEVQGQYNGGGAVELFTVGDIDTVWLTGDVFEHDLALVHPGDVVRARTIAYPARVFSGTLDWIASRLDPTTRAARVRSRMQNADHALVPEMSIAVEIVYGTEDALIVPSEAVSRIGEMEIVFVDRGATPEGMRRFAAARVVAEPLEDGRRTRLRSGVLPDERIVVRRALLLTSRG
jgi:cobalt-zinc-cadmium efflux system membrane fusion protein